MSELLAAGKDLKNLQTTFAPLKADGTAAVLMSGDGYKPELRLSASEVADAVKAWAPKPAPEPKPEPTPAPTPSGLLIGVNGGSGWGIEDAKKLLALGIASERIELGGPYTTLAESVANGFRWNLVVVGNVDDSTPLSAVNVSSWVAQTVKEIQTEILPVVQSTPDAVLAFECGNEMYAKSVHGWNINYAEPARYAEMYVALAAALKAAGITIPLLPNSYGMVNNETVNWLAAMVKAQPSILQAPGLVSHPYGRAGEDWESDLGLGALEAQHAEAIRLGFANPAFYISESGFRIVPGQEKGENVPNEAAQASQLKLYLEDLSRLAYARCYFYFKVHGEGAGNEWGLVSGAWTPRPALQVLASFA